MCVSAVSRARARCASRPADSRAPSRGKESFTKRVANETWSESFQVTMHAKARFKEKRILVLNI